MATGKDIQLQLAKHAKYAFGYLSKNPHLALSSLLFIFGAALISTKASMVAGALFGAGASLLGAWITEFNTKRSKEQDRVKQEADAKRYLAPELNRTIERALYIHSRAIPNFSTASVNHFKKTKEPKDLQSMPGDLKEDFFPYLPVLYPNVEQFKHLTGDDAVCLVAFYDSLYELDYFVRDWWERDGQLKVNIYLGMLQQAEKSLELALTCIEKFELDSRFPPRYAAWQPISNRVQRSLNSAKATIDSHLTRANITH